VLSSITPQLRRIGLVFFSDNEVKILTTGNWFMDCGHADYEDEQECQTLAIVTAVYILALTNKEYDGL